MSRMPLLCSAEIYAARRQTVNRNTMRLWESKAGLKNKTIKNSRGSGVPGVRVVSDTLHLGLF